MRGFEFEAELHCAAVTLELCGHFGTVNGGSEKRLDVTPDLTNKSIVSNLKKKL